MAAVAFWALFGAAARGEGYQATLWTGLLLIPAMALTRILGGALRGIGQGTNGLLVELVMRQGVFMLLLAGWIVLVGAPDTRTAMALHVLGALIALSYGAMSWRRSRPVCPQARLPPVRSACAPC